MSQERRNGRLNKFQNAIKLKETEHEKLQKQLSASFEASKAQLEKLQNEYNPQIKLMRAATPSA